MFSEIQKSNADVVLLQETHRGYQEVCKWHTVLAARYPHFAWVHPGEGDQPSGGAAILSKWPILSKRVLWARGVVEESHVPALMAVVGVPVPGQPHLCRPVRLLSVHLRSPIAFDSKFSVGAGTVEKVRFAIDCVGPYFKSRAVRRQEVSAEGSGRAEWCRGYLGHAGALE